MAQNKVIFLDSGGQKLGGKDHTTIMYSCEKIKNAMKVDSVLSQEVNQLIGLLRT